MQEISITLASPVVEEQQISYTTTTGTLNLYLNTASCTMCLMAPTTYAATGIDRTITTLGQPSGLDTVLTAALAPACPSVPCVTVTVSVVRGLSLKRGDCLCALRLFALGEYAP